MLYRIHAYKNVADCTANMPALYESRTGNWKLAEKIAQDCANEYGFCIVVNTDTGNRTEFVGRINK